MIYGQLNFGPGAAPAVVIPYAASFTPDLSQANVFEITLAGALTVANPTYGGQAIPQDGMPLLLRLIQDATGNRLLTLGSQFTLGATVSSYTLSTTGGKVDYIGCLYRRAATKWDVVSVVLGY